MDAKNRWINSRSLEELDMWNWAAGICVLVADGKICDVVKETPAAGTAGESSN